MELSGLYIYIYKHDMAIWRMCHTVLNALGWDMVLIASCPDVSFIGKLMGICNIDKIQFVELWNWDNIIPINFVVRWIEKKKKQQ